MVMTELAKIAINFETDVLSTVTKFYRIYMKSGAVDISRFNRESLNKAEKTMKNFNNALAEEMYSVYGGKESDFVKNKNIQMIFTKSSDSILASVSYATLFASLILGRLVSKGREKEGQELAYQELNNLYSNGLKGSPKYNFEGSINFVDNETAYQTDLTKNIEVARIKKTGLVYIPYTYSPCPKCSIWQGKYLIDDVYVGAQPDGKHQLLSYAMAFGFLHPNCRDTFIYVESDEEKPVRDARFKSNEKIREIQRKRYEAEQRQRELAKQARAWKRKQQDGIDSYSKSLVENRIKEKLAEARQLRDEGHMLRVNYRMFQTNYEYRSRRDWDVNSLRNR